MRRREFIAGLGSAAWPLAARAQRRTLPVIGFLNGSSAGSGSGFLAAFRRGLREERFVEGENVTIQPRWADGQFDRLPALAMELVNRGVAVIAAGNEVKMITPINYNPFDFDDRLSDWVKDAQRSIPSPQAAAQPSPGDADQGI
jgi:hypothetical protein